MAHFKEVLQLLMDNKLFAEKNKCIFGTTQIEYLSHIISKGLVAMDVTKIEGVFNWPTPKSVKDFKGFFGVTLILQEVHKTLWTYGQTLDYTFEERCTVEMD